MRGLNYLTAAVAVVACAIAGASCGDASGCGDFNPTSDSMQVGQSQDVTVRIEDGFWGTPDVAGGYWDTDQPTPQSARSADELDGVATLVDPGTVEIDFGRHGVVRFTGPIGCD